MADFAASILAPTVDSAMKYVGAIIKRQFIYLCCFSNNINGLETEAEKLDNAIQGLQERVNAATNNLSDVNPEVIFWLKSSGKIKEETNGILSEARNVGSGCLRVATRFTLSRRAVKKAAAMVQQRENYSFANICLPPRAAASKEIPLGTSVYEFESRRKFEEDIMTALRDKKENMIGICGMGGLGKTIMAKRIMNRALGEHVFEEVVMVVVSQQVDESKIQLEIGGSLGLDLKDESSQARVQKLHERLVGTKKILLVLDDVWKSLNLNDIGIPCGNESKGCTILITSRNSDALSEMGVKEVFKMEQLSEEDAWFFFREKVGTCVDEGELKSTAIKVMRECKCLPIALATVGAALRDAKDMRVWNNVLKQLRKPNPKNTPDFITKVYNPLIVSYNNLYSEEVKSLLLLCCLFPEDCNISIDHLAYLCMGLHLFEDMGSCEDVRTTTWTLINVLKSRSLLLDSNNEDCVRMHDVVRDVCVFICKQKGYIGGNDCTWIAHSGEKIQLPAPNLHLLVLGWCSEKLEIDDAFFEGVRELKVLFIEGNSFTSLPQTAQPLRNLRMLFLIACNLKTISCAGDLVNLEILILRYCKSVKELPLEVKRLNRLKLLELSNCRKLQRIGPGIISSLVGLEELKFSSSFLNWEGDDGNRENVGVRELESLTNLTCLKIEIKDPALAAVNMRLSSKLERFEIGIRYSNEYDSIKGCNILSVHWLEGTSLGYWIQMQLLRLTEYMLLTGNGANELDFKKMAKIRMLGLGECESLSSIVLPPVESLGLFSLPKLQEIWDAPISLNSFHNLKELVLTDLPALNQLLSSPSAGLRDNSYVSLFTNLSSIEISKCPRLHNLGQLSLAGNDCLSQLESLKIEDCEMMEQVFLWSEEVGQHQNHTAPPNSHITKLVFPKLKKLKLVSLPNLIAFCHGVEGSEFPILSKVKVYDCPKMRSIISTTSINENGSNHNTSGGANNADVDDDHNCYSRLFSQPEQASFTSSLKKLNTDRNPFCGHKIHVSSFNGLEQLSITDYQGSESLFTSSMTENLVSLRELSIDSCDEMVQVIKRDMEKATSGGGGEMNRLFPNLRKLYLGYLRKLVTFCECECGVEWPLLKTVKIVQCPEMKIFISGSLKAPNLEDLEIGLKSDHVIALLVNVSCGNMKKFTVREIAHPLCRYKINVSSFTGLDQLSISEYHGRMSLFTSSIAGNLFNLTKLKVDDCSKMLKLIEDEKGVGNTIPIFPNLQELTLWSSPKLVTFWEWDGDVEWPSLREVSIYGCPNLANITLGPLTTPNLADVRINFMKFGATNDVNGMLQRANPARLKENEAEEEEISEEDYESEGQEEEDDANEGIVEQPFSHI